MAWASALIIVYIAGLSGIGYAQDNFNLFLTNKLIEDQVIFELYTREESDAPLTVIPDNLHEVDVGKDTKFLIHGYTENSGNVWYKNMTIEYLKKGDYNIVQVDWSKPASDTYKISSWNAQIVGRSVAKLITRLYNNYNLSLNKIHIIGHSLGCQVAGYAGKEIIKRTGLAVYRITALDAAGPLFEGPLKTFEGLGKSDANIVDAIHTDGGVFGRNNLIADADFFPNGGVAPQPGCDILKLFVPPSNFADFRKEVFCSHIKSYYYFIASINQEKFIGVKCTSWDEYQNGKCNGEATAMMGDDYAFSNTTTGTFFLKTNPHSPFARN